MPDNASIPATDSRRSVLAERAGRRAVALADEDVRPRDIMTREAFQNAIRVVMAIGGSTNAQPHLAAMARHAGVELKVEDWTTHGRDVPLLVNMQPAGKYLGERFHRAGGVPAVLCELLRVGRIDGSVPTVTGRTLAACR